jgi:Flp pilus assembly protein TadG
MFFQEKSGNFGIMFAILVVPVIAALGSAFDYSYSYNIRSKMMSAADAAALGAISEKSPGYAAAIAMSSDGRVSVAEVDGKNLFLAQSDVGGLVKPSDVTMTVTKTGHDLTATATFSVPVPTTFMQLFGKKSVTVAGHATAVFEAQSATSYADYYMLLDNTPSMGIGATRSDIDALIAGTSNASDGAGRNCAFACHMVWSNSGVENQDSTYLIARKLGVTLRIDVLAAAVQALISDAEAMQGSKSLFRFAAYNFGNRALEPGYQISRMIGLTDNLASVKRATGDLSLMTTDHHNYNEDALTSFDTALTKINSEIPGDGGAGSSTSDRQKVVFLITDGVGDSLKARGCTGFSSGSQGRCFEPIDTKFCDQIKNRNIKIAVLYTTYTPINDHLYNTYISKFSSQIGSKLQACASDDLYFESGPNDNMQTMLKKLFVRAASSSKLRIAS